ncbi:MAG: fibronectin type III domain-containing protein [Verrucomicrobiota bacterium]
MSTIKLGLDKMTVPDKIQFGRQVVSAMTDNPNFATPNPTLAVLTDGSDELEAAYNTAQTARQLAKLRTTTQDNDEATWDGLITQIANYVQNISAGDKAIIESAGFSVRNAPAPVGLPDAPTDVIVVPSEHAGSADISWDSDRGYRSFTVERAEDAPVPVYQVIGNTTKKFASFNSMVSGKKYWFRVASVGPAGQSAWSDPVPLFAP